MKTLTEEEVRAITTERGSEADSSGSASALLLKAEASACTFELVFLVPIVDSVDHLLTATEDVVQNLVGVSHVPGRLLLRQLSDNVSQADRAEVFQRLNVGGGPALARVVLDLACSLRVLGLEAHLL